jgi:hypothetical protein
VQPTSETASGEDPESGEAIFEAKAPAADDAIRPEEAEEAEEAEKAEKATEATEATEEETNSIKAKNGLKALSGEQSKDV